MSLSPEMRSAIVGYARQFIGTQHNAMDCSHFIWRVLNNFFPNFPYMQSAAYLTSPLFHRVTSQVQPADLIVWQGHIAFVVDPVQGLFIGSQTSTGVAVASLRNPYWAQRRPEAYLTIA